MFSLTGNLPSSFCYLISTRVAHATERVGRNNTPNATTNKSLVGSTVWCQWALRNNNNSQQQPVQVVMSATDWLWGCFRRHFRFPDNPLRPRMAQPAQRESERVENNNNNKGSANPRRFTLG